MTRCSMRRASRPPSSAAVESYSTGQMLITLDEHPHGSVPAAARYRPSARRTTMPYSITVIVLLRAGDALCMRTPLHGAAQPVPPTSVP